ncbi:MAG: PAAR domain-containing protein [Acidobacteriota bacterium]
MQLAARLSDPHVCLSHGGGPIGPPCCPTVLIEYLPAARVTDLAFCCAPIPNDMIIKGSFTVLTGFLPQARLGDPTAHGGSIVKGCFTVIVGDSP